MRLRGRAAAGSPRVNRGMSLLELILALLVGSMAVLVLGVGFQALVSNGVTTEEELNQYRSCAEYLVSEHHEGGPVNDCDDEALITEVGEGNGELETVEHCAEVEDQVSADEPEAEDVCEVAIGEGDRQIILHLPR